MMKVAKVTMQNKLKLSYKGYLLCFVLFLSTLAKSQNIVAIETTDSLKVFRAGASTSNITPPLGMGIVGNFIVPEAEYIHDELHTRALVLNDGQTTLVFSIVDNVGVPREVYDAAKAIIHNKFKIPVENMMMSAVHNHSAVNAHGRTWGWHPGEPLDDYQRFLAKRIADGVQSALTNLRPARISWGGVNAPEHVFSRRYLMKDSVMSPFGFKEIVKMNPGTSNPNVLKPVGSTDPEVSFIAVESLDGKPMALLANYSLHYVGGVPKGHISGDYFAAFADKIQELLGADRQDPPFVGIMSNGTSGNVNNIDVMKQFPVNARRFAPYEKINYVANDIANKVYGVYKNLDFKSWVSLGALQTQLRLKVRHTTPEIQRNIEKIKNKSPETDYLFYRLEDVFVQRAKVEDETYPDSIDVTVQAFRIGDLSISAAPFEIFAETGLEIKKRSPFGKTFVIELANGHLGYLPTPEQHKLGGYETWFTVNRAQEDASEKLVETIMKLFSQLESD